MTKKLEKLFKEMDKALRPETSVYEGIKRFHALLLEFYKYLENFSMDKQIRSIEKNVGKTQKKLKKLEKADKKRDPVCEMGEKVMKKKKKK